MRSQSQLTAVPGSTKKRWSSAAKPLNSTPHSLPLGHIVLRSLPGSVDMTKQLKRRRSFMHSLPRICGARVPSDECTQLRAGLKRLGRSPRSSKARPGPPTLPQHFHISTPLWEIVTARFTGWKKLIVRVLVSLSSSVTCQTAMACEAILVLRICYAELVFRQMHAGSSRVWSRQPKTVEHTRRAKVGHDRKI